MDNNTLTAISLGDIGPLRPQSLQVGQVAVATMCDKEQQTPQDTNPPFFIPPPLLPGDIPESASDLDFTVSNRIVIQ